MVDDTGSTSARIRFAIANRRLAEVRYAGTRRLVEPHDYGLQGGRDRLLVFQRRGPARPGHTPFGWRLLDVPKIEAFTILDGTFAGSRGRPEGTHYDWEVLYARVE